MFTMIALVAATLCTFEALAEEQEQVEVRRVLVADKSMKPAAAAAQPKYEYIRLKTEGKTNPELLCDTCCKRGGAKEYVSKPALKGKTVAFACATCGELCYREDGVEVKYTDEKEVKALREIETELKKPVDKSQKPSVQNLQIWSGKK